MTNKRTVIIGIGVPGVGKTTHLRQLAEIFPATYVSLDDLRAELLGFAGDHTQDERVWDEAYRRIKAALASGQDVIVDGAGVNPDFRRSDIKIYRDFGADQVLGYWFQAPLEVALARNKGRQVEVPEDVIKRWYMLLQDQPPSVDEGFDEVRVVKTI